jgi:putative salt-induced outer membrane protein YdiY
VAVGAVLLLSAGGARAQEKKDWQPETPMPEKFDWIQLKSGEWLKGELIAMYKDELEFDSAELDPLTFAFGDVRQVLSAATMQVGLRDGTVATGQLRIEGDKVLVIGDRTRELERSQILTITSGEPKESSYWSGKVGAGANFRRGNTEQLESNARVNLKRRTVKNRAELDYLGNYNVTEDTTIADNQRASLGWDRFISDRFFLSPVLAEYFRDPFQNIAHRGTIGVGAGYQLIDSSKVDWQVTAGVAYQNTRFADVAEGEPGSATTPTVLLGTTYNHELSGSVDFGVNYRFFIVDEESGQYTHHFVTGFEFALIGSLDFDVTFVWDRIQKPQQNSDGTLPKQDDYRLNFALSFDF